jgi:hypothetical protein
MLKFALAVFGCSILPTLFLSCLKNFIDRYLSGSGHMLSLSIAAGSDGSGYRVRHCVGSRDETAATSMARCCVAGAAVRIRGGGVVGECEMTEPQTYIVGECSIEVYPTTRYLRTIFPNGLVCHAAANDDAENIRKAWTLGYAGDTYRMSLEHELLHSILAEMRGEAYSSVLYGVAVRMAGGNKERVIPQEMSDAEEGLIMDLQRWLHTCIGTVRLIQSGVDLVAVSRRLGEITGG